MTRDEALKIIGSAKTLAEIQRAKAIRGEWLASHPNDSAVEELSEGLLMTESALKAIARK